MVTGLSSLTATQTILPPLGSPSIRLNCGELRQIKGGPKDSSIEGVIEEPMIVAEQTALSHLTVLFAVGCYLVVSNNEGPNSGRAL